MFVGSRTSRRERSQSRPRRVGGRNSAGSRGHRVRLPLAAIFDRPATTTPPTQREPTHSLVVLLRHTFPLFSCLSASLRVAVCRALLYSHERPTCRAALVETPHRGHPSP
jgi:hypothetical protein